MSQAAQGGILEKLFKLRAKNTTVRTEIIAGITTFVAMAYILFVNPSILTNAVFLVKPQLPQPYGRQVFALWVWGFLPISPWPWLRAWA